MIKRIIEDNVKRLATQYPVVTITGPRQSGKTTLSKMCFPDKEYLSLENLDVRRAASQDPKGFLDQYPRGAVLDEIQRVPDLLSYIQGIVDQDNLPGKFILTGSRQFELMDSINQSLAGRTAIVRLLPFEYSEVYRSNTNVDVNEILFKGFYPRIFDKKLNPTEALSFYMTTYIERDVRSISQVQDLSKFELFVKVCASQTGQILNLSHLSNECGISVNTAKQWLSVLEASFIIFLLRPHHQNFRKRLTKSPKLYFIDTGLAALLLGVQKPDHLKNHPLRGALFETFIVTELLKKRFNHIRPNNLYYFRDHVGNEVDVLMDQGKDVTVLEIKSGMTVNRDFFKGLSYYCELNQNVRESYLVYAGQQYYREQGHSVVPFYELDKITNGV